MSEPAADPLPHDADLSDPYCGFGADRALLLAEHVVYVQGGFSTPDREARRLRADIDAGAEEPDWDKLRNEVEAGRKAKATGADIDESSLDLTKIRRYKELREAQGVSEAEGKAMKEEADALQQEIVDMFAEAGTDKVTLDGKTIYLHRATFAQRCEGIDAEAVKAALRAAGPDAAVLIAETVNAQTLSAFVRELVEGDEPVGLPPELVGILELGEKYTARITAAGRSKSTRSKK